MGKEVEEIRLEVTQLVESVIQITQVKGHLNPAKKASYSLRSVRRSGNPPSTWGTKNPLWSPNQSAGATVITSPILVQ